MNQTPKKMLRRDIQKEHFVGSPLSKVVPFRKWSLDEQQEHHLGAC